MTDRQYPDTVAGRDRFILSLRPPRAIHDPWRAHGVTAELEPEASGSLVDVITVFLTGRECPWRCAMCDLWQYTTEAATPGGAIPQQIRDAVGGRVPDGTRWHVKLYNARRGYVACRLTPTELTSEFKTLPYVTTPGAPIGTAARFVTEAGRPGLEREV